VLRPTLCAGGSTTIDFNFIKYVTYHTTVSREEQVNHISAAL
jgi:hypothetical protein